MMPSLLPKFALSVFDIIIMYDNCRCKIIKIMAELVMNWQKIRNKAAI